jgi:hypothetical protein
MYKPGQHIRLAPQKNIAQRHPSPLQHSNSKIYSHLLYFISSNAIPRQYFTLEEIIGVAFRSIVRHAVLGTLTSGLGNVLMLAGDIMDISDTMDGLGAIGSVDTGSGYISGSNHDLHFGGKHNHHIFTPMRSHY